MVGVGFFVICMNFNMTSRELLQESKIRSTVGEIQVKISRGSEYEESMIHEQYIISYDTYRRINEKEPYASELELLFTMDFHSHIFIAEPPTSCYTHVYFMNENLFAHLYGFPQTKGTAYLGKDAYQALLNMREALKTGGEANLVYVDIHMSLEDDRLLVGNKSYPYEIVTPVDKETIMFDKGLESGYDMVDAVILPIEDNMVPVSSFPEVYVGLENVLFLRYRHSNEWHDDIVARLLRELNTDNKAFAFKVDNSYLELKREIEDFSYDMDRWMILAVSIIMLSGIGCVGSMYFLLYKRRHFMAVSIAYGSTLFRIIAETIIEVFLVLLVGGVLGIIASPILREVMIYTGELKVSVAGIGIVMIITILFSVLSVLLGMYAIKAKNVAVSLRKE